MALSQTIKITGSSSSRRKRKLECIRSTPSNGSKATHDEDVSKRNKLMPSCVSYMKGDMKKIRHSSQRERSWIDCEELNEFSETIAQDISDDDYNGVDEIDLSEDEAQLTLLEEKYIIDSELRSIRGHRGASVGDDSRQSLTESDFPELFGHPNDSVPTYTSDAGFLYETNVPSSRRCSDSPIKRVRFEDHTRITGLCAPSIDVSGNDFDSDVLSDHTALYTRLSTNQSCAGEDIMTQKSDDVKSEVRVTISSSDDNHLNAVQPASASDCDDFDPYEASSSGFDCM